MEPTNPDPERLDREHAARQIESKFACEDPSNIEAVFLRGSFANPEKPVDRNGRSDADLFVVVHDESRAAPQFVGSGAHPSLDLRFEDEVYSDRTVDMVIGTYGTFRATPDTLHLEIPVSISSN